MAGRVIFMRGLRTSSKHSFSSSSSSIPSAFSPSNSLSNTTITLPKNISTPSIHLRTSLNLFKSAAQAYRQNISSTYAHHTSRHRSPLSSPSGSFMRGISTSVSSCGTSNTTTTRVGKGISSRGLNSKSNSKRISATAGNNAGESVEGTSATGMDAATGHVDGQGQSFIDKGGGIDPGGGSSNSNHSRQKAQKHAEQMHATETYGLDLLDAAARASKSSASIIGATLNTPPPRQKSETKYTGRPEPAIDSLKETEEEEKRSRRMAFILLACSLFGGALTLLEVWVISPDNSVLPGYIQQVETAVRSWYTSFSDPTSDKLLPDPLPENYQRPYTMVIALNDCMTHATWDKENGWRAAKRPYVDWFLSYMSQFYEIVVFTTGMPHVANPIIEKLDPYRFIMYRLFRDSTRFKDNKFLKDLSVLNRDLSKTFIIDVNPDSYSLQPENAIPIKKWTGEADDVELLRLIPFLEALAMSGTSDVRPVLKSYQGLDIPSAWAAYQTRLREEFELKRKAHISANKPGIQGFLASLFGGGTRVAQIHDANPIDLLQQQASQMREDFWKGQDEMKRQLQQQRKLDEAEMEKQLNAMKAKKWSLWEFMARAPPLPGQPSNP